MLDIKFIRENLEIVKENIRKKFQDEKLPLVDEVLDLDKQFRETKMTCDDLRTLRKTVQPLFSETAAPVRFRPVVLPLGGRNGKARWESLHSDSVQWLLPLPEWFAGQFVFHQLQASVILLCSEFLFCQLCELFCQ